MLIPDHLNRFFRMFEAHGGQLKAMHGKGTRRAIKFYDSCQSLMMDVKIPGENEWVRITADEMRSINKKRSEGVSRINNARNNENVRKALMLSPDKSDGVGDVPVVESDGEQPTYRHNINDFSPTKGRNRT